MAPVGAAGGSPTAQQAPKADVAEPAAEGSPAAQGSQAAMVVPAGIKIGNQRQLLPSDGEQQLLSPAQVAEHAQPAQQADAGLGRCGAEVGGEFAGTPSTPLEEDDEGVAVLQVRLSPGTARPALQLFVIGSLVECHGPMHWNRRPGSDTSHKMPNAKC